MVDSNCTGSAGRHCRLLYLEKKKEQAERKMNAWWFFCLTLLLEFPVVYLFFRKQWKAVLLPFFLLNLFTWPLLHYLLLSTGFSLPLMELGVAIVEMTGYKFLMNIGWQKSFAVSFLANALSYGTGILINNYMG